MSEMHASITSLCRMKRVNYSKHTLRKQDCIYALSFTGELRDWVFCKELCWFLRCRAGKKKERFRPAIGGISKLQHLLFWMYSLCTDCSFNYFLPIRPKKRKICLKNAIFRKWAMWNTGFFYSVFGPLFFVCLFGWFFFPLCSQVFSHFFLATRKKNKNKRQKMG